MHNPLRLSLAFCVYCSLSLPSNAQQDDIFSVYDIESTTGFDLGKGYDILTGSPRSLCVEIKSFVDHPEFGPDKVSFRAYRVENSEQLDKALGVSATASISAGIGSASVSASYNQSLSVSEYNLNYVVESAVRRKGKSVVVQELQERYKRLLSVATPDAYHRFRTICGDGFISEIPVGGDFRAVVQISTNSRKESEEIALSLGGSYSVVSGAASFSSVLKKASEHSEVRIWSVRRGGEGAVPIAADDIATSAAQLPVQVKAAPSPVQMAVLNYIGILDDPMMPMPTFSQRAANIQRLATISSAARDQSSDARYILEHPSQFFGQPDDIFALNQELTALAGIRELIAARAEECVRLDGVCFTDDIKLPLPLARPARR